MSPGKNITVSRARRCPEPVQHRDLPPTKKRMDYVTDTKKSFTKGRKKGRMSRKERDALCGLLPLVRLSTESVLDKKFVFGRAVPLYIEIGFGSGAFLFEKAKQTPQCDFIGIEIYVTGIAKLMVSLMNRDNPETLSISNVRVFNKDAKSILVSNIPPDYLEGVYILFPDPWHKKRHRKRRLINPEFARLLCSRLRPGGSVVVATDSQPYAGEIEEAFMSAGFDPADEGAHDIETTTYALKARRDGREVRIYRFIRGHARFAEHTCLPEPCFSEKR